MRLLGLVSVLVRSSNMFFLKSNCVSVVFFCLSRLIRTVMLAFRYSILATYSVVHCLLAYETLPLFSVNGSSLISARTRVSLLTGFFRDGSMTYLGYLNKGGSVVVSNESIYASLRWQEREVSEFFGISFFGKSDNRSLFLPNNFGHNPLLKSFPTVGFLEISVSPVFGLAYSRVSL